jgi:hypothetical protein
MTSDEWVIVVGGIVAIIVCAVIVVGAIIAMYWLLAMGIGSFFGIMIGAFVHGYHLLAG